MHILFKTLHGSRLYNLNTADSDWDYYTVVDKVKTAKARYARQTITGDDDSMVVDIGTWMDMLHKGVPQAWEAAFSTKVIHDEIGALRSGLRVGHSATERYLRTITSFVMTQDPKTKRHGLRLALNAFDFQRQGFFNPTLTDNEVDWVTEQAKKDCDSVYAKCMSIALDRLPPRMLR